MILDDVAIQRQRQSQVEEIPSDESQTSVTLCDLVMGLIASFSLPSEDSNNGNFEENYLRSYLELISGKGDLKQLYRRIVSHACEDDRRLLALGYHLRLTDCEILALVLLLGVEKDALIGRCIAYVQAPIGGSRPTMGLINSVYAQFEFEDSALTASLLISGKAVETGIIKILNPSAPIPEQSLSLPIPLVIALQGLPAKWPNSRASVAKQICLPESVIEDAKRQTFSLYQKKGQVLLIRSGCQVEAENIAALTIRMHKYNPLFLDNSTEVLPGLVAYLYLHAATPVFTFELGPNDSQRIPKIPGYLGPIIVVCSNEGVIDYPEGVVLTWTIEKPTRSERLELWEKQTPPGTEFHQLAEEHLHSSSRIAELSELASRVAENHNRTVIDMQDLYTANRLNEGTGLGSLAQLIHNTIPDDALVLGEKTRNELQLLSTRCKHRETLSDNLGVTLRSRYQSGVRSLFVGSSGTGKTLAASWLATALNLPLYRVDLASVSSKYIGETEKNLSQLLNKAEQQEVILLFDEADSMFGKRTDINDSNDRFANAQTNYLLQRIETYSGIVLMTSNSRARFDSAFTRRIDMIIEFQPPKPEERRELWRCHLGDEHNLSHSQLNQLSSIADLCGGHIRNIVLTASLLAKSANREIRYDDLVEGIKSEYRKLGKKIPIQFSKI